MFGRYFFGSRFFGRHYFGGPDDVETAPLVPDPLLTLRNRVVRARSLENIGRVRSLAARRRRKRILGIT